MFEFEDIGDDDPLDASFLARYALPPGYFSGFDFIRFLARFRKGNSDAARECLQRRFVDMHIRRLDGRILRAPIDRPPREPGRVRDRHRQRRRTRRAGKAMDEDRVDFLPQPLVKKLRDLLRMD